MIELPITPWPVSVDIELIDFGFLQPVSGGAAEDRIDRPGSRFSAQAIFPPMQPDEARVFSARLLRAKRQGLRIEVPLLGVSQAGAGAPTVDGGGQAGSQLSIKGLTAGFGFKEGFWLALHEFATDRRYLHTCLSTVNAGIDGKATIQIEPPLRAPFFDGATILLAAPTIEGNVTENLGWRLDVDWLVKFGAAITIREKA